MGKITLKDKIKDFVSSIGWKLFLWGMDMTQEMYWEQIYEQERKHRNIAWTMGLD